MDNLSLIRKLSKPSDSKIVLLVIDGLGGIPHHDSSKTELETARTPNLDLLAAGGICGLSVPIIPGITPGSAPGHLALFGYNPFTFQIGRGALEALGIGFNLELGDIAARGNFCTVDQDGLITDRRAGRISTEEASRLCQLLKGIEISGVKVIIHPVKEHRLVAIFRGGSLSTAISDSDPQQAGVPAKDIIALHVDANHTAKIANDFLAQVKENLAGESPANMVLLRGFSTKPQFPSMADVYKLKAAAIATYPMYRGLAKIVGMDVLETGQTKKDELLTLQFNFEKYDFFFVHIKETDTAGEDGDFNKKVASIEHVDSLLPNFLKLEPDVIVVTGDHSTPATLKGHSWHPVPVLLHSRYCRPDLVSSFSERECINGGLGRIPATDIMLLAMANALKLDKFGA
ncbi:MAG: 2,3-bisphosphoglycerate-independent phosphoglycerate mutase [Dehalococcoidia bacterium]|nr:MAG: 2,3-bisphosphoglycerate-independent phosphoglycerate mutase [Dehalococcoidia bacterium]